MSAGYARIKNRVLGVMGEEGYAVMEFIDDLMPSCDGDYEIYQGPNNNYFVKEDGKRIAGFAHKYDAIFFVKNAEASGKAKTG